LPPEIKLGIRRDACVQPMQVLFVLFLCATTDCRTAYLHPAPNDDIKACIKERSGTTELSTPSLQMKLSDFSEGLSSTTTKAGTPLQITRT